jgi:hypothetical protein
MLSAAIESSLRRGTTAGAGARAPQPSGGSGLIVHSGRRGRVAIIRVAVDWDGSDGAGPSALLDRAMRAGVQLVVLDLSVRRVDAQGAGTVERLIGRLNRHGVRYAVVAKDEDHLADLGPAGPVYSTVAIALGTLGVV